MEKEELLHDFTYPRDFIRVVNQKLTDIDPWSILLGDRLTERYSGIKSRYPNRSLIPFARRWDNDDVACFDTNNPQIVHIIHDFAKEGWEQRQVFNSFWDWFRKAVNDMIEHDI